jgi:hypothetical protein
MDQSGLHPRPKVASVRTLPLPRSTKIFMPILVSLPAAWKRSVFKTRRLLLVDDVLYSKNRGLSYMPTVNWLHPASFPMELPELNVMAMLHVPMAPTWHKLVAALVLEIMLVLET